MFQRSRNACSLSLSLEKVGSDRYCYSIRMYIHPNPMATLAHRLFVQCVIVMFRYKI